MNVVAVEIPAVAHVEQLQSRLDSDGIVLNAIELRHRVGVDRCDQMQPRRFVEGLVPVFRRTRPGVAELDRPLVHALDELGREGRERGGRDAERPQSLKGQADVEAADRLALPALLGLGRDLRNAATAGCRGGEPAAGRGTVGDFKHEIAHARLAIAAQDIALHVGGIKLLAHQPTPNCWRTWAAE